LKSADLLGFGIAKRYCVDTFNGDTVVQDESTWTV